MRIYALSMLLVFAAACAGDEPQVIADVSTDAGLAPDTPPVAPTDTSGAPAPDTSGEDTASVSEDTAQTPEDTAQAPEDTAQAAEDTGQVPEDTVQTPEDTGQVPEDTASASDTQAAVDTQQPPMDTGPAGPGAITLAFRHMDAGWSAPLSYDTIATSTSGEPFKYDFLRYWVSNVSLKRVDGTTTVVPSSYYLVEETPQNTRLDVDIAGIPAGTYASITFSVGVDEAHNHSLDLMEGELSANVGMSWNWKTGYIFLKIEGTFGADDKKFKMHVGTDENYRVVTRTFAAPVLIDSDHPAKIWLRADVTRIFDNLPPGPHLFSFSPLAKTVADNYGSWFDAAEVTAP